MSVNIAHITPSYFGPESIVGGGERYIVNIMRACATQKSVNRQLMVTLIKGASQMFTLDGFSTAAISSSGEEQHLFDTSEFVKVIEGYKVVHVHQCLSKFGLIAASHARLAGAVVIGTDHGGGEARILSVSPQLASVYDFFHAQSEFATSSFCEFNVPTVVIRGPVDDMRFTILPKERRNEVVSVGRMLAHKGFEAIISAIPEGLRLSIIGTPYDQYYYEHLRNISQGKDVHFLVGLSDVDLIARLQQASCYVQASTHFDMYDRFHPKPELLALAPLEALCCGTPSIVSEAAALPELSIVQGCTVYSDPLDLRDKILATVNAKTEQSSIRDSAVEHYGLVQFGEKYMAFLREYGLLG